MADLSPNLLKQPKGLAPSRLENDPLWHMARLSQLFSQFR